ADVAAVVGAAEAGVGLARLGGRLLARAGVAEAISGGGAAAGDVLGPEGAGQFIRRRGLGTSETATVVRRGEFVNRAFDSAWQPGANVWAIGSKLRPGQRRSNDSWRNYRLSWAEYFLS